MGWLRDRRGHGELRLRLDRRTERRAAWLDRQLRARRRAVWRTHSRLWVEWAAGFGLLLASLALLESGHPQARAALLGAVATAAAATLGFGLMLVDGSLLARLGRMAEESVGDELRGAAGVYGVVSNLPFELSDVDHVVLARAGALAVEVKQVHGLRRDLPQPRLAGMLEQTRTGARRAAAVLRQSGVPVEVWPVLVLTGAGAPDLPGGPPRCRGRHRRRVAGQRGLAAEARRPQAARPGHRPPGRRRPAGLPGPPLGPRPPAPGGRRSRLADPRAVTGRGARRAMTRSLPRPFRPDRRLLRR